MLNEEDFLTGDGEDVSDEATEPTTEEEVNAEEETEEVEEEGDDEADLEPEEGDQEEDREDETSEDTDDSGDEKEAEKPGEDKKYKLKILDQEREYTIDQVLQMASKSQGAEEKFQEAAETREKVINLLENMKDINNTPKLLEKLGIDVRKMAENYLYEIYNREGMPEEQRKVLEAEEKIKELEEREKARELQIKQQQQQQEYQYWLKEWDRRIGEAVTSSNLPKTPEVVKRVAGYLSKAQEKKIVMTEHDAVALVEEDLRKEAQSIFGNSRPEQLAKLLGDEKLKELTGTIVKSPLAGNKVNSNTETTPRRVKSKRKSWRELKEEIERSFH